MSGSSDRQKLHCPVGRSVSMQPAVNTLLDRFHTEGESDRLGTRRHQSVGDGGRFFGHVVVTMH